VLSNAPRQYTGAVLQLMGIESHFDALHCIESTGYQPKPSLAAFHSMLRPRPDRLALCHGGRQP
jgi:putative hydrolase of the HAD superfamily